jgi:hypothetical protein
MQPTSPAGRPFRPVSTVDLASLGEALGDSGHETRWWYDPESGQVEMSMPDWDDFDDQDANTPSERGLLPIDPIYSRAAYDDMVDFAESVADAHASDLLLRALEGRGAFRRFRTTLHEFPALREHWYTYLGALNERRAIDWLVDWNYADRTDAEFEREARTATLTAVLASIGSATGAEFDEEALGRQWDDVRKFVDSGRAVTVLRSGKPWAVISPLDTGAP